MKHMNFPLAITKALQGLCLLIVNTDAQRKSAMDRGLTEKGVVLISDHSAITGTSPVVSRLFYHPVDLKLYQGLINQLLPAGIPCDTIWEEPEVFGGQDTSRKTFNVYLDLELVRLVDLWAYRIGSSRSRIIEDLMAQSLTASSSGDGTFGCSHADLRAKWAAVSYNRSVRNGPFTEVPPILGEEYTPE